MHPLSYQDLPLNTVILHDEKTGQWLLFEQPLKIYSTDNVQEVPALLASIEKEVNSKKLHAAGYLSYEASSAFDESFTAKPTDGFPACWFGLYQNAKPFDFPITSTENNADTPWELSVTKKEYAQAIQKIKAYIRQGDTYQVNYTYRLDSTFENDPWGLFTQMVRAQGNHYSAFIKTKDWTICSASPELFFTLDGNQLTSSPMKGTAGRGLSTEDDLAQKSWLEQSNKNRAENLMIVDMVRNDIGRIADIGSVQVLDLFEVKQFPTVWQMTSDVIGNTDRSICDIFGALFPAASITGAPKASTMKIIDELEPTPRKLYTGSIGYFTSNRRAQFNVAIRTVVLNNQTRQAQYSVGGGITIDSTSDSELEECYTKARILTHMSPLFNLLETLLWSRQSGYYLLDQHLDRLAQSARFFGWSLDLTPIRKQLKKRAGRFPKEDRLIRLLVSQSGGCSIKTKRLRALAKPYCVSLSAEAIDRQDPFLYHKTSHRLSYENALINQATDDVILWNEVGDITESTIANIVIKLNGELYTPPVKSGLLPGVYRAELIAAGKITERVISIEMLKQAEQVYLINSVRKMWPVDLR